MNTALPWLILAGPVLLLCGLVGMRKVREARQAKIPTERLPNNYARIRKHRAVEKFIAGCFGSLIFFFLALVVPLWPITMPLFLLMAVLSPVIFLVKYWASAQCPRCGQELEIYKLYGGMVCKGCKSSLRISGSLLEALS